MKSEDLTITAVYPTKIVVNHRRLSGGFLRVDGNVWEWYPIVSHKLETSLSRSRGSITMED